MRWGIFRLGLHRQYVLCCNQVLLLSTQIHIGSLKLVIRSHMYDQRVGGYSQLMEQDFTAP